MFPLTTRRAGLGVVRDPWALHRRLTRMLDDAFRPTPWSDQDTGTLTSNWLPPVDIFENENTLRIVAEVPGVSPEDVKISLENNVLSIQGEKKQVAEEQTERVHRYERTYGTFERTFTLPATIDAEHIEASYRAGVLTVSLPKVERARPREIPVKSS